MSFVFPTEDAFPELAEHRSRIRAWLTEHAPDDWRERLQSASRDDYMAFERQWLARLHEGGLAVPHWPAEHGGADYTLAERIVLYEEMVRLDVPQPHQHRVAINHAAETILRHGAEGQQRMLLPGILRGEIWCQGFSEPGAGSDLAALSTRATRTGDTYVVNGQKVWSSYAEFASWCLLLARTDPDAPQRAGITMFLLDMRSPGVEVRPIRQLTGEADFCEIFLTDVEIPAEMIVGAVNDGWRIVQTTLTTERGIGVIGLQEQLARTFVFLVQTAETRPTPTARRALDDAGVRQQLVMLYTQIEALRGLCHGMLVAIAHDRPPGPEASVVKLFYSEVLQRVTEFGVRLDGLSGQLERPPAQGTSWTSGNWIADHLKSWAWTIGGGTSEIQRNMIGERVLGLPRDPRPS